MSRRDSLAYDVVVVGAGPVGSATALAYARRGAKVALIEANPKGANRLAGEWLHPPAMAALEALGIDLRTRFGGYDTGAGFVVFPEDGSEPIELPYADGTRGFSCAHSDLVGALREAAISDGNIAYLPDTRATRVESGRLDAQVKGESRSLMITAPLIVGADGRHSVVRANLGLPMDHRPCSRMVGVVLDDVDLPFEGYGHVCLGAPGPILIYRIAERQARLIADLPLSRLQQSDRAAFLWENYGPALPASLRAAFYAGLRAGAIEMAVNSIQPRVGYGRDGLALVGDSVGHYSPLTALGMTLGFADALELAAARNLGDYEKRRLRDCRVPELIAIGIYEAFARSDKPALAIRHAIFDIWRRNPQERANTMRYLACQDTGLNPFATSFAKVVRGGLSPLLWEAASAGGNRARGARRAIVEIVRTSLAWLNTAMLHRPLSTLVTASPPAAPSGAAGPAPTADDTAGALARGIRSLVRAQAADGSWEGEVVWCPMLAAQYAIACQLIGAAMPAGRRRLLLRQFERTQLPGGSWGLHPHAAPSLYVTTLVYVAARLLGVAKNDALLKPAADFIRAEGGVAAIPSWGKFWLAMLGLYEWRGLHPILPEAWALPEWLPLHPSRFYCHTRHIYMGMSAIYGRKFRAPETQVIRDLRDELYPGGYGNVDFTAARWQLREGDLFERPGAASRVLNRLAAVAERWHAPAKRLRLIGDLENRIRWELRTTDHTSISPVSGLLNIIALWLADRGDKDIARALHRFEGWIWEDDTDGTRVAGARSVSWDTAFAVQALAPAADLDRLAADAMRRGRRFLATQQIDKSFDGYRNAYRNDPKGGWCFAGVWHGWPVSDCTAEAVSALLAPPDGSIDAGMAADAQRFILRCQNRDGGFGSYEARRTPFGLEWMNPAEMFGNSMTEASYVECTASSLAALAECRDHGMMLPESKPAIDRALAWLRQRQRADGAWDGAWGVHLIYGTMFGITGLRAAGVPATDPAIRRACAWLKARQRTDGGWGEHFTSCLTGEYVEHRQSQVIQTAWALRTLLAADDPAWPAIDAGARFLAGAQAPDGTWPNQDMAGVFFNTALLDYALYRSYFPVWALALYEARRRVRDGITGAAMAPGKAATAPVEEMADTV